MANEYGKMYIRGSKMRPNPTDVVGYWYNNGKEFFPMSSLSEKEQDYMAHSDEYELGVAEVYYFKK